jgi:hypothetical protein
MTSDPTYDPDDFFDLTAEKRRLIARPADSAAPPWLYVYDIDVADEPWPYAQRMRSVLAAALDLAATQDFGDDPLPANALPRWFVDVTSGDPATSGDSAAGQTAPDFAARGSRRYMADQDDEPWELQDWLHRFDPEAEVRAWRWWDITHVSGRRVRLWVDNGGEEFIASQDLRWLAYVSGAHIVHEPTLERPAVWAAEPSTGLPLKTDS